MEDNIQLYLAFFISILITSIISHKEYQANIKNNKSKKNKRPQLIFSIVLGIILCPIITLALAIPIEFVFGPHKKTVETYKDIKVYSYYLWEPENLALESMSIKDSKGNFPISYCYYKTGKIASILYRRYKKVWNSTDYYMTDYKIVFYEENGSYKSTLYFDE